MSNQDLGGAIKAFLLENGVSFKDERTSLTFDGEQLIVIHKQDALERIRSILGDLEEQVPPAPRFEMTYENESGEERQFALSVASSYGKRATLLVADTHRDADGQVERTGGELTTTIEAGGDGSPGLRLLGLAFNPKPGAPYYFYDLYSDDDGLQVAQRLPGKNQTRVTVEPATVVRPGTESASGE